LAANNVDAHPTGTLIRNYFFDSLVNQNPANGVPGLVGYCVYTDGVVTSASATRSDWRADRNAGNVSFARAGGNKTNVPLNGVAGTQIGTASFSTAPSSEIFLLHIADTTTCRALYGGDATTCYVLPKAGPICNAGTGNTQAAYNAIPTDVQNCSPPSLGFEATQTNEFGDKVTLDTNGGANTKLMSMTVDFQSYGCETSGHWNTANCVSPASPGTFTVPGGITANIYDVSDLINPIASSTINPNIPYRPTAVLDTACPNNPPLDAANSRFLNGAGQCVYSRSVPLTFNFAGQTLPSTVVWTVEFNTSTEGYNPIGPCGNSNPGCGYDSLNVGALSYPNAPYAGTDVDADVAYRSFQGNGDVLAPQTGWIDNRPLGQIVLGP
jgi:hypothetical protein